MGEVSVSKPEPEPDANMPFCRSGVNILPNDPVGYEFKFGVVEALPSSSSDSEFVSSMIEEASSSRYGVAFPLPFSRDLCVAGWRLSSADGSISMMSPS